jgi:predicted small metal-binding protein
MDSANKISDLAKQIEEVAGILQEHVKQKHVPEDLEIIKSSYENLRKAYFNLLKALFILIGRKYRNNFIIEPK